MATPDLDVIKEIPGYKVILKVILKSQIQQLVEQLASHTDEESVFLTASVSDGTLSHLGSDSGKGFLDDHEDVKSQFLGFCLKRHHRRKQEKERERLEKEKEEAMKKLAEAQATQQRQFVARQQMYTQRFTSPQTHYRHPRAAPYHINRHPNRHSTPKPTHLRKSDSNEVIRLDGPVIKTENTDAESEQNQIDLNQLHKQNNQTNATAIPDLSYSGLNTSSMSSPVLEQLKSERSENVDSESEMPTLAMEGDNSGLDTSGTGSQTHDGEIMDNSSLYTSTTNDNANNSAVNAFAASGTATNSELHDNVIVKVEALTESDDLEITGVEMPLELGGLQLMPGQDMSWGPEAQAMLGYDPTMGATGSQEDLQQGYSKTLRERKEIKYKENTENEENYEVFIDKQYANKMEKLAKSKKPKGLRAKEAMRAALYRSRLSNEKKERSNKLAKERMRKYREKNKESNKKKTPKVLTRIEAKEEKQSKAKLRAYWRETKKESRAKETQEKKQLNKLKRQEKYKKNKAKKSLSKNKSANSGEEDASYNVTDHGEVALKTENDDNKSPASTRKAISMCSEKLPSTLKTEEAVG